LDSELSVAMVYLCTGDVAKPGKVIHVEGWEDESYVSFEIT